MIRLLSRDDDDPPPLRRLDPAGLRTVSSLVTTYLETHPESLTPEELLELIRTVRDATLGREHLPPVQLELLR